jgi:hypothetical protein
VAARDRLGLDDGSRDQMAAYISAQVDAMRSFT